MTEIVSRTEGRSIGRNEPCPCGSGKKYKRCCGVSAAPKLSEPKAQKDQGGPAIDPSILNGIDPQMLTQMTQAFQRLPKGQLQRMQVLMQKAMSGKDISAEAQEFERSLPPHFQELMRSFALPAMDAVPPSAPAESNPAAESSAMTEEKARELVARAAAEGAISQEQAQALLASDIKSNGDTTSSTDADVNTHANSVTLSGSASLTTEEKGEEDDAQNSSPEAASKFEKFWKTFSRKRSS